MVQAVIVDRMTSMESPSRTPEGRPNRCPHCGNEVCIEPSSPMRDAPCPCCGQLIWFPTQAEEHRRRLEQLPDQQLQTLAAAKLQGYSNKEVAQQMDVAVRTVARRWRLIRQLWEQESGI